MLSRRRRSKSPPDMTSRANRLSPDFSSCSADRGSTSPTDSTRLSKLRRNCSLLWLRVRASALHHMRAWLNCVVALWMVGLLLGAPSWVPATSLVLCGFAIYLWFTSIAVAPGDRPGPEQRAALVSQCYCTLSLPALEVALLLQRLKTEPAHPHLVASVFCHCSNLALSAYSAKEIERGTSIWRMFRLWCAASGTRNLLVAAFVYCCYPGENEYPAPGGTGTLMISLSASVVTLLLAVCSGPSVRAWVLEKWTHVPLSAATSSIVANDDDDASDADAVDDAEERDAPIQTLAQELHQLVNPAPVLRAPTTPARPRSTRQPSSAPGRPGGRGLAGTP